ncbi:MAG: MFS transporter [Pseudomonadota bacterium]
MRRQHLSLVQLWNVCFGLFGVQIVWGLQNANTSRIFQTLGADVDQLAILWIAAPATGLLVQPIVGHFSDRTWGRLGRRRPYIFYGALLTALALWLMPNAPSLWIAALALWALGISVNVTMEPFRAFVADLLPEDQRTQGYAVQVFFIGMGAVLASALPWTLTHWFGLSAAPTPGQLPQAVKAAFYIGGVGLLGSVMWSVFTTREEKEPPGKVSQAPHRPESSARLLRDGALWTGAGCAACAIVFALNLGRELYLLAGCAIVFGLAQLTAGWLRKQGRTSIGVLEIVEDILHMPPTLRQLAVVQFFTWFGLFAMWIYTTPAITARHYGAADSLSSAYNEGADWVGVLFAIYNGVAAVVALATPWIAARIGRPVAHALMLGAGALGFAGLVIVDNPALLWLPIIGIGIAWASILSTPYAMLSVAAPPEKMGVYMGIHNLFVVIPQLAAATVLGPLIDRVFGAQAIYALGLAGVCFLIAAIASLFVTDHPAL